ncbi:unnamed protein product [Boreogadus saida]
MPRLLPGTLLLEGVSGVVEEVPGVEEHEGENMEDLDIIQHDIQPGRMQPGLQPGREPASAEPGRRPGSADAGSRPGCRARSSTGLCSPVDDRAAEPAAGLQPGREPGSGGPRKSAVDFRYLPRKSAADLRDLPRVRGRAAEYN